MFGRTQEFTWRPRMREERRRQEADFFDKRSQSLWKSLKGSNDEARKTETGGEEGLGNFGPFIWTPILVYLLTSSSSSCSLDREWKMTTGSHWILLSISFFLPLGMSLSTTLGEKRKLFNQLPYDTNRQQRRGFMRWCFSLSLGGKRRTRFMPDKRKCSALLRPSSLSSVIFFFLLFFLLLLLQYLYLGCLLQSSLETKVSLFHSSLLFSSVKIETL